VPGSGGGGGGGGTRGSGKEDPRETSTMEARRKGGFAASLQAAARCSTQREVNRACFMANWLSQKSVQQLARCLAAEPSKPSPVARFMAKLVCGFPSGIFYYYYDTSRHVRTDLSRPRSWLSKGGWWPPSEVGGWAPAPPPSARYMGSGWVVGWVETGEQNSR
jgi:hypothetical protein